MLISPPPPEAPEPSSLPHAATPKTATAEIQDRTVTLRRAVRSLLIWLPQFAARASPVHVYASKAIRVAILDGNLRDGIPNGVNFMVSQVIDRKHSCN